MTTDERLYGRAIITPGPLDTPCWIWPGCKTHDGYGMKRRGGKMRCTHVLAFEDANGPVPAGKEIDHLCRVRACFNPQHLEAKTHLENVQAGDYSGNGWKNREKTHCAKGHEFNRENTNSTPRKNGHAKRHCRVCDRIQQLAKYHRKKLECEAK